MPSSQASTSIAEASLFGESTVVDTSVERLPDSYFSTESVPDVESTLAKFTLNQLLSSEYLKTIPPAPQDPENALHDTCALPFPPASIHAGRDDVTLGVPLSWSPVPLTIQAFDASA